MMAATEYKRSRVVAAP
jgi:hypothetical protein